jgi:hypothetical protein
MLEGVRGKFAGTLVQKGLRPGKEILKKPFHSTPGTYLEKNARVGPIFSLR